ncbi:alcohol dehydrogenase catalytic domain-containing protein [Roseivivax sp. CAU 1761]
MRAVRINEGATGFAVEEVARPARAPGGALVRLEAAMVASYMGALPSGAWVTPPRPFTPGQCAIGVVEEGAGRLRPGQRVYFDAFTGSRDAADPAEDHGFLGCFGLGAGAAAPMAAWPDGSFAEVIHAPEACFTPLPEAVAVHRPELLCRLGWLGTALQGLERGGFAAGERVAINGATGALGAGAVLPALALGAARVHVLGRRQAHLDSLVALDPERVVAGPPEAGACELLLDCSAGADASVSAALIAGLPRFGRAVFVGALGAPLPLDAGLVMRNSLTLRGSYWFTARTRARLLSLVAAGRLDLDRFSATAFPLAEIDAAIAHARDVAGGLSHTVLVP